MPAFCQLTRKWPWPGRDSIGREQREITGLVWEGLLGTEYGHAEQEQREVPGPVCSDN